MASRLDIHIEKTADALSRFVAERVAEILSRAIAEHENGSLVLSGGETPCGVYRILGSKPLSERLDWNCVHLFFGDERAVPPDHPDSNYGMIRRELIDRIPVPEENVHRIHGELSPQEATQKYADEIQWYFNKEIPRFDCVLLGVGEDGHTASLFPGTEALNERESPVAASFVPRLGTWRVTLTFPVINNAREVIFIAEGERKAPILKKMIESPVPSLDLPATMVRPHNGVAHWMLDSAAASSIRHPGR